MSPNRHLKYSIITIKVNKKRLKKSLKAEIEKAGGILCLTADHGNSDDMYEHKKDGSVAMGADGEPKPKTSHSLNPVPEIIYAPEYKGEYDLTLNEGR